MSHPIGISGLMFPDACATPWRASARAREETGGKGGNVFVFHAFIWFLIGREKKFFWKTFERVLLFDAEAFCACGMKNVNDLNAAATRPPMRRSRGRHAATSQKRAESVESLQGLRRAAKRPLRPL